MYRWLAANLEASADTFITMPGLNSLYLWTGKEPPTTWNTTTWMTLFDSRKQERIVDRLKQFPNTCAVRNQEMTQKWLRGQDIAGLPLVRFVNDEFRTMGSLGGYDFRIGRGRPPPELVYCVRPLAAPSPTGVWTRQMALPPLVGRVVHRMTLADALPGGKTIADTQGGQSAARLGVSLEDGLESGALDLAARPVDLGRATRFRLSLASADGIPTGKALVVRLFEKDGSAFASVPVLDDAGSSSPAR
jgi:hypothetical protein